MFFYDFESRDFLISLHHFVDVPAIFFVSVLSLRQKNVTSGLNAAGSLIFSVLIRHGFVSADWQNPWRENAKIVEIRKCALYPPVGRLTRILRVDSDRGNPVIVIFLASFRNLAVRRKTFS